VVQFYDSTLRDGIQKAATDRCIIEQKWVSAPVDFTDGEESFQSWLMGLARETVFARLQKHAATYVPRTKIKAALGHPMTAGVALWAFAHLLANGTLHDIVLFGAFLVWALVTFVIRRGRDARAGTTYSPGSLAKDAIAVVAGVVVSVGFALFLHGPLIGVRPF